MPTDFPRRSDSGMKAKTISHNSAEREPSPGLPWQILAGLVAGAAAGLLAPLIWPSGPEAVHPTLNWLVYHIAEPAGQIFLRLIFMVVLPLVFSALVLGVVGLADLRKLGRTGTRTLLLTIFLSTTSVAIGLMLSAALEPGARLPMEQRETLRERFSASVQPSSPESKSLRDALLDIIPRNPIQEMAGALDGSSPGGGMLAVLFFSLAFGIALAVRPERSAPLVSVLEGIYDAVMVIIAAAMKLAPVGVAGLVFALTVSIGLDILAALFGYVLVVLLGLALQMVVIYPLLIRQVARYRPLQFFRLISEAILTAFGTSSSNATLPTALRVSQRNLGIDADVSRFVFTVGSTANQNGTALYEGVTVLFLAQVFGMDLTFSQQVLVVLMSILAGIGTAGVPGGSLPLVAALLQWMGIPPEGIAIILGVERLLDMCRTTLNVTGDIVVAACVDRWRGQPKG